MGSKEWLRRAGVPVLGLLLLLVPMAGCSKGSDDDTTEEQAADDGSGETAKAGDSNAKTKKGEDGEEAEDQRVPVEVAALERGYIEEVLRFSTNLEAESEVQVFSQAARLVTGLYVEEGDDVRKGQVLLRLQDDAQRTQLDRVESQLAKAQREHERQRNLFSQQLISEQAFNEATYDLEQLELALSDAKRELGYTEVKAPIAGTVTQRLVNVGDQVTINQHLFDIVDFDSIVARVFAPEKTLPRLAKGSAANVYATAFGSEPRRGEIDRIAPVVDSRTGTVKVTVSIPRSADLRPGMYVSVELITAVHEDALLIPKRALVYDDEQIYVFRIEEAAAGEPIKVERLQVEVELEDRDHVEPSDRFAVGDRIVVAGQAGLKSDAEVRLVGEKDEVPAPIAAERAAEEPAEETAE
jgi:membrane fusion protein, multidrug efflux system